MSKVSLIQTTIYSGSINGLIKDQGTPQVVHNGHSGNERVKDILDINASLLWQGDNVCIICQLMQGYDLIGQGRLLGKRELHKYIS